MNSSIQNKKFNLTFFFGALGMSLLMASGAVVFAIKGMSVTKEGLSKGNQVCLNQLKATGFNPRVSDDEITVSLNKTAELEALTLRASVVLATCFGYELKDFCAGGGCGTPGLSFTLTEKAATP